MLILKTLTRMNLHGSRHPSETPADSGEQVVIEEGFTLACAAAAGTEWLDRWQMGSDSHKPAGANLQADTEGPKQLAVETKRYGQLSFAIARVLAAE
jgi:hypothetical protein